MYSKLVTLTAQEENYTRRRKEENRFLRTQIEIRVGKRKYY